MNALDAAILRTVLYGDVFSFAMTAREIHHFLISDAPALPEDVERALADSADLRERLVCSGGLVALAGREELFTLRTRRDETASHLLASAAVYGGWLARVPFVRMVGLTGALAVRNPTDNGDDLDYMLVTAPGRVWLARAFAILLVRLARLRGAEICPNYVVDEMSLAQDRQDIFAAHEVVQLLPLFGDEVYGRFQEENAWAWNALPNARGPFYSAPAPGDGAVWRAVKGALETALGGRFGDRLERWERQRKLRRFAPDLQTPHSAARLDNHTVKGHFDDHGHRILAAFAERAREMGVEPLPVEAEGDNFIP